jgi:hypothetical protein
MDAGWRHIVVAVVVGITLLASASAGRGQRPPLCSGHGSVPMDLPMRDIGGSDFQLAGLKAQAILVQVWSTFDKGAQAQIPLLLGLHSRYEQSGLVIVALSGDDLPGSLQKYAKERAISYTLAMPGNDSRLRSVYGARGIGHMTLLLPNGTVCGEYGPGTAPGDVARDVAAVLGSKGQK